MSQCLAILRLSLKASAEFGSRGELDTGGVRQIYLKKSHRSLVLRGRRLAKFLQGIGSDTALRISPGPPTCAARTVLTGLFSGTVFAQQLPYPICLTHFR